LAFVVIPASAALAVGVSWVTGTGKATADPRHGGQAFDFAQDDNQFLCGAWFRMTAKDGTAGEQRPSGASAFSA
jgi:hypothetical protein